MLHAQIDGRLAAALVLGIGVLSASPRTLPARTGPPQEAVAITGVTVVPMDRERRLRDHTVVVREGRIVAVGPTAATGIPEDARRIDGTGRYLLPGLVDMHVHLSAAEDLALNVANGVTTVRNMHATGLEAELRDRMAEGDLVGPRILTSGAIIDGPGAVTPGAVVVTGAEEARAAVASQRDAGVDFVKVYSALGDEAYRAVVEASAEAGLPVVGHVPRAVGLAGVLAAGQRSIEHLSGYVYAALSDPRFSEDVAELDTPTEWFARPTAIGMALRDGSMDPENLTDLPRLRELAAATARAGTANVPTLVAGRGIFLQESGKAAFRESRAAAYVRPDVSGAWDQMDAMLSELGADDLEDFDFWLEHQSTIVRELAAAGARILVGTDAPNPRVVPGFAIHEELRLLTRSGLTPFQALAAASRHAAEFLDLEDEVGTVAVGRVADLVLVAGDPLEDLDRLRRPEGVMVRGRWLDRAELDAMLRDVAITSEAGRSGSPR